VNNLPDTWTYFYAGYAVILLSILGYVVSLIVRWRQVKTRLDAASKRKINP
jgi:hypothetical protein